MLASRIATAPPSESAPNQPTPLHTPKPEEKLYPANARAAGGSRGANERVKKELGNTEHFSDRACGALSQTESSEIDGAGFEPQEKALLSCASGNLRSAKLGAKKELEKTQRKAREKGRRALKKRNRWMDILNDTRLPHRKDVTESAADGRSPLVLCDSDTHCIPHTEPAAVYPQRARTRHTAATQMQRVTHQRNARASTHQGGARHRTAAWVRTSHPTFADSIEPDMDAPRRRGTACCATDSGVYNATDGIVNSIRRMRIRAPRENTGGEEGRSDCNVERHHPVVWCGRCWRGRTEKT
ncbi:hypothetical protein B0H19DRAFT_1085194 [Mycena capillaripes]|nr:hypothetical protein B0H19DRAFT_1085194 [Mycena capillaripes]